MNSRFLNNAMIPNNHKDMVEKIQIWDLDVVKRRLIQTEGLNPEQVDKMEEGYRQYLILLGLNPGVEFPVSDPIDTFAHKHLLFTREHRKMTKEIFNDAIIDHVPTLNDQECIDLLPEYQNLTLPALEQIFGEHLDPAVWIKYRCVCRWDLKPAA